jgi:hypothetical protein
MPLFGLILVLLSFQSYFIMIFVFQRFTYKTWIFHSVILAGMTIAIISGVQAENNWINWSTIRIGIVWFLLSNFEFKLSGSKEMMLKLGFSVPAMTLTMVDGTEISERDLINEAPVLLILYRGWWCPTARRN